MNEQYVEHPKYPNFDEAACGAVMLQAMLPRDLMVNIHPIGTEERRAEWGWFELSVSDK